MLRRLFSFASGAVFGSALIVGALLYVVGDLDAPSIETAERIAGGAQDFVSAPATASTQATAPAPRVQSGDPARDVARMRARDSFRHFIALAIKPGNQRVALQVELPASTGGFERIWLSDCALGGPADFKCIVEEASSHPEVKVGDAYSAARADIADWMVEDDEGRIHGGFTLRASLRAMKEAQRSAIIGRLAPLPR